MPGEPKVYREGKSRTNMGGRPDTPLNENRLQAWGREPVFSRVARTRASQVIESCELHFALLVVGVFVVVEDDARGSQFNLAIIAFDDFDTIPVGNGEMVVVV